MGEKNPLKWRFYGTNMPNIDLNQANEENIARAAELLNAGQVIVFPTETVYGVAADANDQGAVDKLYEIKSCCI